MSYMIRDSLQFENGAFWKLHKMY